jgi:hypothetical protein
MTSLTKSRNERIASDLSALSGIRMPPYKLLQCRTVSGSATSCRLQEYIRVFDFHCVLRRIVAFLLLILANDRRKIVRFDVTQHPTARTLNCQRSPHPLVLPARLW